MFTKIRWVIEGRNLDACEIKDLLRVLSEAEIIGQIKLCKALISALSRHSGEEISKKKVLEGIGEFLNQLEEEYYNLVSEDMFYDNLTSTVLGEKTVVKTQV